jgi:hypothetical protein
MTDQWRYIWQLMLLSSSILILGILVISRLNLPIELNLFIVTLFSVTGINLSAWMVMTRGILKGKRDGAVILLAGIGLKFLLYLLYILVVWMVIKILTKPFIVTFFALYLMFTFLLAIHLFKLLKNK